jgi:hypothetical protein
MVHLAILPEVAGGLLFCKSAIDRHELREMR